VKNSGRHTFIPEVGNLLGEISRPGGLPALVIHHLKRLAFVAQPQHGVDEIWSVLAVKPCGANNCRSVGVRREDQFFSSRF
jgi:hypothetical protein